MAYNERGKAEDDDGSFTIAIALDWRSCWKCNGEKGLELFEKIKKMMVSFSKKKKREFKKSYLNHELNGVTLLK